MNLEEPKKGEEAPEIEVESLLSPESINELDELARNQRVRQPEKRPSEGLAHPQEELTVARGEVLATGFIPEGKPDFDIKKEGTVLWDGNVVGAEGNSELNNLGLVDNDIKEKP